MPKALTPRDAQPTELLTQPATPGCIQASCSTRTPHPPWGITCSNPILCQQQVPAASSCWKPASHLEDPIPHAGHSWDNLPQPYIFSPDLPLPPFAGSLTCDGSCRRELSWIVSSVTPRSSCKWTTAVTWTWRASSKALSAAMRRLPRRARLKWRLSTKPE